MKLILIIAIASMFTSCKNLIVNYEDEKGGLTYQNNVLTITPNPVIIRRDK